MVLTPSPDRLPVNPRALLLLLSLSLTLSAEVAAQATADLRTGSRVEMVIEKLVGFGLIDDRVAAVRPWSNGEAERLIEQARANLDRLDPQDRSHVERLLADVPASHLDRRAGAELVGGVTVLDSPKGFPIAITGSPTIRSWELPSGIHGSASSVRARRRRDASSSRSRSSSWACVA